jgi:hypothetical protein
MLSGIFRDTLWNQTIPDALRGGMASRTTPAVSAWCGGLLCVTAVAATCAAFPALVRYRAGAVPPRQPAGSSLSASDTAR